MEPKFLVIGLVIFLGLTGLMVKITGFAEPCGKIDFEQNFVDGNLTVTNTGDVSSGGKVTGYIEIGEEMTKMDETRFKSLDVGESIQLELEGQIAVLKPYRCSSKHFKVKTESKKITECLEGKTNPEGFKQCAGIN
jgi:hypothetical protein